MADEIVNRYEPDEVSPPGETLQETLDALHMSQAELAERMGRPKKTINEIIKGKAALTAETALQLESVLGVPASFWNSREQIYRQYLARCEESQRLVQSVDWLKRFPISEMIQRGWLRKETEEMVSGGGLHAEERNGPVERRPRAALLDVGSPEGVGRDRWIGWGGCWTCKARTETGAPRRPCDCGKTPPLLPMEPWEADHATYVARARRETREANADAVPAPLAGVAAPQRQRDQRPGEAPAERTGAVRLGEEGGPAVPADGAGPCTDPCPVCRRLTCEDPERCAFLYRPLSPVRCSVCAVRADADVPLQLLCWRHWLAVPGALRAQLLEGGAVADQVVTAAATRYQAPSEERMDAYYCERCDTPSPAYRLAAIVAGYRWRCERCKAERLHHKAPRWRRARAA